MAKKITDLNAGATPQATDLLETSQNISTMPASRKISFSQIQSWIEGVTFTSLTATTLNASTITTTSGDLSIDANSNLVNFNLNSLSNVSNLAAVSINSGSVTNPSGNLILSATGDVQISPTGDMNVAPGGDLILNPGSANIELSNRLLNFGSEATLAQTDNPNQLTVFNPSDPYNFIFNVQGDLLTNDIITTGGDLTITPFTDVVIASTHKLRVDTIVNVNNDAAVSFPTGIDATGVDIIGYGGYFETIEVTSNASLNSLTLLTSGASNTQLNFHTDGTHNTTWQGIWATTPTGNIAYERTGKTVTLIIPAFTATATTAATITNTTVLPTYLRPVAGVSMTTTVLNNGAANTAVMIVTTGGSIIIFGNIGGGNFGGSGSSGLSNPIVVTYLTS